METEQIDAIVARCTKLFLRKTQDVSNSLEVLKACAQTVGQSFCGSWLGYHSRIYYEDFQPVPPGARFSMEWGFELETVGNWVEWQYQSLYDVIAESAKPITLNELKKLRASCVEELDELRDSLHSIVQSRIESSSPNVYLSKLEKEILGCIVPSARQYAEAVMPTGQFRSRDMAAVQGRIQVPAHVMILSEALSVEKAFGCAEKLINLSNRLKLQMPKKSVSRNSGTHVFIGHGRSLLWRELKDFVSTRLGLPWDEFNRVPVAGITNIHRLTQMLDSAAIAFLVLTAEDERLDGSLQARMNVIHETGLFQGRLGFTRAIILLEEGCQEFSNVEGLGQIRFPAGNIQACFEDVRRICEREGLIPEN